MVHFSWFGFRLAGVIVSSLCLVPSGGAAEPAQADSNQDAFANVDTFVAEITQPTTFNRNRPEREEWLQDNGFGIFITWAPDAQYSMVISHSLVGASDDYRHRYFQQMPQTFNPSRFDPESLAALVRRSGAKYSVFTTKHHAGFAMWRTRTTNFGIERTPYKKDIVAQFADEMRRQGVAVGFYYSPEDFYWIASKGVHDFDRLSAPQDYAPYREAFEKYVKSQIRELFTRYGKVDVFFNDGEIFGTTNQHVWDIQPDTLITRTAIPSPEQTVPSIGFSRAWESIITTTDQWNYKANDVARKPPQKIIESLIETRAKGGALLINLALRPDGAVPDYDHDMLTTIGAWNFVNQEAVFDVRPWVITHEGNIWYTRKKGSNTVYAFLQGQEDWQIGESRNFLLRSVKATASTRISVLGSSGEVVEYRPDLKGKAHPTFVQGRDGLAVTAMRAQRLYNNYQWPYPTVVKLENVEPALAPPVARTLTPEADDRSVLFKGELLKMGDTESVLVGFEYRDYGGFAGDYGGMQKDLRWTRTPLVALSAIGTYELRIPRPSAGREIILRTIAVHPSTGVVIEANEAKIGDDGKVSLP